MCSVLQCVAVCCSVLQSLHIGITALHRKKRSEMRINAWRRSTRVTNEISQKTACSLQSWLLRIFVSIILRVATAQENMFTNRTSPLLRVAVCCSVLQCVVVCCSVLQCVAVCCSVLQCAAVCCRVLQCVAVLCGS